MRRWGALSVLMLFANTEKFFTSLFIVTTAGAFPTAHTSLSTTLVNLNTTLPTPDTFISAPSTIRGNPNPLLEARRLPPVPDATLPALRTTQRDRKVSTYETSRITVNVLISNLYPSLS